MVDNINKFESKAQSNTSVNTEMEILTITLRSTETRQNKRQCEQKSPLIFFQIR